MKALAIIGIIASVIGCLLSILYLAGSYLPISGPLILLGINLYFLAFSIVVLGKK